MVPDIGVFGRYTYLVTEVVFGAFAYVLLSKTGAIGRAAKTVLALYPLAYVWDRYTLEIGIFQINLRTGRDFLGIPIEEHIFMVVVPSLVVGFYELVNPRTDESSESADRRPETN